MSKFRKSYEISLWDLVPSEEGYNERKGRVIGSDTMTGQSRAINPELTVNINGSCTFKFSMATKYFEFGDYVDNPNVKDLVNEKIIKLKYDDEWYDLILKDIEETSKNINTYSCEALHINQLSRTGYELEFDNELENNMGTAAELSNKILVNTDWIVDEENSDFLQQKKEDYLYEAKLGEDISVIKILKDKRTTDFTPVTIAAGSIVYLFYSDVNTKNETIQLIYRDTTKGDYKTDENRIVINADNYIIQDVVYNGDAPAFVSNILEVSYNLKGEKIVQSQRTKYDSALKRMVGIYNKDEEEYYGYTNTVYDTPDLVKNFLVNTKDFSNTYGWSGAVFATSGGSIINTTHTTGIISADYNLGEVTDWIDLEPMLTLGEDYTLSISPTHPLIVYNSGIISNKTAIGGFAAGEKYYFRYRADKKLDPFIAQYEIGDKGEYKPLNYTIGEGHNTDPIFEFDTHYSDGNYNFCEATCLKSVSEKELQDGNYGFFLNISVTDTQIFDIQFFKKVLDENGVVITPDSTNQMLSPAYKTEYLYYKPNQEINSAEELVYEYRGYENNIQYIPNIDYSGEMIRSISGSKSNCFNLLQSICEMFECWIDFNIEHDYSGKALNKSIRFKKYIGEENYAGFKRGINLKNEQRTLDSGHIVTKLYVENNANEFAKNGFCTIARAKENPLKGNVIFNFDHYINTGILDYEEVQKDLNKLYLDGGDLKEIIQFNSDKLTEINAAILQYESLKTTYDSLVQEGKQEFESACEMVQNYKSISYETAKTKVKDISDLTLQKYTVEAINLENKLSENIELLNDYTAKLEEYQAAADELIAENEEAMGQYQILEDEFIDKYRTFIQEGTWIDENYMDDDLYYLDALSVAYTSSKPEVSYNLNVMDISCQEDYENYEVKIGDKTYIEDPEFFGWNVVNGLKTPRKEEVVVSQIVYELDDPSNNQVTIQNYRSQFENFFQRVGASVKTVEYRSGAYERSAKAVTSTGEISYNSLQKTFQNNAIELSNAKEQSVVWGDKGITVTAQDNINNILRIINTGLFLSQDGGNTWTAGVTAGGINTNLLTTGILHAEKVQIMSGDKPTFMWNAHGINAYEWGSNTSGEAEKVNYNKFVRYDQYGLYGYYEKTEAGVDYNLTQPFSPNSASEVLSNENVLFALSWAGLKLRTLNGGFNVDENGVTIKNLKGDTVFSADYNGDLSITGIVTAKKGEIGGWTIHSGKLTAGTEASGVAMIQAPSGNIGNVLAIGHAEYNADGSVNNYNTCAFRVTKAGILYATGAEITGTITAEEGSIGGWTIGGTTLKSKNGEITLRSSSTNDIFNAIYMNNGAFYVRNNGYMHASDGDIGGWKLTSQGFSGNPIYVGETSNTFALDVNGNFVGKHMILYRGDESSPGHIEMGCTIDKQGLLGLPSIYFYEYNANNMRAYEGYITLSNGCMILNAENGVLTEQLSATSLATEDFSQTSDIRLKNTIEPLSNKYLSLLDKIDAKSFYLNKASRDVQRLGFIAQDVVAAAQEVGLNVDDLAAVLKDKSENEYYSLDYIQFIPILWQVVKELKSKIEELENLTKS